MQPVTIPVEGHVFSTAVELCHAPYNPKTGTVEFTRAFAYPIAETKIYGFKFHEDRVYTSENPSYIRVASAYAKQEKLLNVEYCVSPKCGKVEYEEWRRGYIVLIP